VAVKVPIFSFEKLTDLDTHLGPEMKSTGEVLGIGKSLDEALFKGLVAAGYQMNKKSGGVLISVRDSDKIEIADIAKMYHELGYKIYATHGTADIISKSGINVEKVDKICDNTQQNTFTLLEQGKVDLLISTSTRGRIPTEDDVKLRRLAVTLNIPHLTSIDTASAFAFSLKSRYSQKNTELVDICHMRTERQKINFVKMQGAGNDYIYIDAMSKNISNMESIAVTLSDRHKGVGGDGAVFICSSEKADAKMRMFNSDGTEGGMCGNAIRCIAKYLFDSGKIKSKVMKIETASGIKDLQLFVSGGVVNMVSVDMGVPSFDPKNIPVISESNLVQLDIDGKNFEGFSLSMGNPHVVFFVENVGDFDVSGIGRLIETHPIFPDRVNVEFVQIVDKTKLRMRVWERGSGETLACGTGASAAVVAAAEKGMVEKDIDISVKLLGGELIVRYKDSGNVILTGDAVEVFRGIAKL
jgi:carbamoyl-phosphate synthase large subunit